MAQGGQDACGVNDISKKVTLYGWTHSQSSSGQQVLEAPAGPVRASKL